MTDTKGKSSLTRLSTAQLNAAISRGIELKKEKVPSNLATKGKMLTAGTEKERQQAKERRQKALQELQEYKTSMQLARRALRNLPKNATQEDYLNAGLPLVNKNSIDSFVMSDTNFRNVTNNKKSKGSSDYRKGGMVLSTMDNRKKK
jgi:hypothetical protein